jgi:hypothetical protein
MVRGPVRWRRLVRGCAAHVTQGSHRHVWLAEFTVDAVFADTFHWKVAYELNGAAIFCVAQMVAKAAIAAHMWPGVVIAMSGGSTLSLQQIEMFCRAFRKPLHTD